MAWDDLASGGRQLVETDWLAEHLDDPDIRVLDCTVEMRKQPDGLWRASSGRTAYEEAHIPNALFVDLLADLKDHQSPLNFMLPPAQQFAAAMGALGIGNDTRVVVYVSAVPWWATRLWWMLRAYGHDHVAVLNGGFQKWKAEDRPTTNTLAAFASTTFTPRFRPELVADKGRVLAALEDKSTCVVNALSPQLFSGESELGYARRGRIKGSVNLSALSLVDHTSGTYLSQAALRQAVRKSVGESSNGFVCYCGGGIAATMDAFVLTLLGYPSVAVYDGSLEEWAADTKLPMEVG